MPAKQPGRRGQPGRASRSRRSQKGRGPKRAALATLALALLVSGVVYLTARHTLPVPGTSQCAARGDGTIVSLEVSQASIAATIAGVAQRQGLPDRAVTIAYAAAMQESKLTDLDYGDQDSVGIFQQRPSEGWGPARLLENPVYASTKFFAALARVPGYARMPVYEAAQAVQHSADGSAYGQFAQMGASMAVAFTGNAPHAVWCSYASSVGPSRLAAADRALTAAFGPLAVHRAGDPALAITVPGTAAGWAVAAWLVSHASSYGIRDVRYQGYQWTAADGASGWVVPRGASRAPAPDGSVEMG
ncbi:MAG: hypothetical protein ACLPN6_09725 [Streptosporangiaceae bacterium]